MPYNEFLDEYRSLGHMNQIPSIEKAAPNAVYIRHHPFYANSSTTKLRVVFNASCKTTNRISLNDYLLLDLSYSRIFPLFYYVSVSDASFRPRTLQKCFARFWFTLDTDFQRILWRPSGDGSIEHFRLLTVTYGLAPPPYLAMRVLKQLALDEGSNYPAAVSVLNESTYVNEVLFGADGTKLLVKCRTQLTEFLKKGGFPLQKWASNSQELSAIC
ncbi:PREDICTED: uncharacterized protein LOC108760041 [Trachymyrmex cornetzi]|uniref:uncharacterized protein LOC108760041 n=1 Tax=Trachymyrmex cornetzi TaxID=471704 RepID=UPI00084EF14B|nr:PREDICTED: uncharacterized protein LOC108760041 [Trachymyrmex cornetzi]